MGNWDEGSATLASYVTSTGSYAGDASIFTGNFFHLRADGTYSHTLMAITATRRLKQSDEGKWSLEDDELVCNETGGTHRYSVLGYGADAKAGRLLVLGNFPNSKTKLTLSNPRGMLQASWYKAK